MDINKKIEFNTAERQVAIMAHIIDTGNSTVDKLGQINTDVEVKEKRAFEKA